MNSRCLRAVVPALILSVLVGSCNLEMPGKTGQPQSQQTVQQQLPEHQVPEIKQEDLCIVESMENVQCQDGQKVLFLPSSWGNEQLPVGFAAFYCNLTYEVVWTPGAVTCIFKRIAHTTDGNVAAK